jgi:hypothetical protein
MLKKKKINEAEKYKTAFISELGLFEFNRMLFGITNATSTFLLNSDKDLNK